jgi:hypothetical protein
MQPWFIATEKFTPLSGAAWEEYIAWSGLTQLVELVSLDGLLCPTVLREIDGEDWSHIVNEDFMLHFFVNLEYLQKKISKIPNRNLLCVYRDPVVEPPEPAVDSTRFEFLGYDLVDACGTVSALTNCGGFPDAFDNRELSSKGLLTSHDRALRVQSELRRQYPDSNHANCHIWAVFRAL